MCTSRAGLFAHAERSLFRAKINSDYNDFVARVALEVVDSAWWKQQLRVKSADSRATALSSETKIDARNHPHFCHYAFFHSFEAPGFGAKE